MMDTEAKQLRQPRPRLARLVLGAGLVACALVVPARAQSVWELTPYRVQVFVALAATPELTSRVRADLPADLLARTDALIGAPWNVTIALAPPPWHQPITPTAEGAIAEQLPKEWLDFDKVMLLSVAPDGVGYRVTARELDLRTQTWSVPVSRQAWQLQKLLDAALDAMLEAFAPLARIDAVEQEQVVLRLKAAALPVRDDALSLVEPGDVFRPVIRYNDRDGNPRRITPVPWTFLTVQAVTEERLDCLLHSGLRSPLSGRRRGRVEQLALAMVPPRRSSILTLQSRDEAKQPLIGYDVYARRPEAKAAVRIGRTDRRGRIVVPPSENPLRVLLVKHGGGLLARLPMIPGLEPELTAEVTNDDERLEVEGFITGLQEELVDLVTRREVLLIRVKARLKAGKPDEAEKLLGELLRLPRRANFVRRLEERRNRTLASDPAIQAKITALFADTKTLVEKHLQSGAIEAVREELRTAKSNAGT